jgi:hypothetical protein
MPSLPCKSGGAYDIEKWEMGNGKWEMGNGKWEMGNGKWEMESRK